MALLGSGGNFKRWGLEGNLLDNVGNVLEGDVRISTSSFLSFGSSHEVNGFALPLISCHDMLPLHRPEINEANQS
jgi:hypothetical protein